MSLSWVRKRRGTTCWPFHALLYVAVLQFLLHLYLGECLYDVSCLNVVEVDK